MRRGAQVSLIREFVAAVRNKRPLVKQMLMGGGKTTVVGPMLALMLADGATPTPDPAALRCWRLQPLGAGACDPVRWSLQSHELEDAVLSAGVCGPTV